MREETDTIDIDEADAEFARRYFTHFIKVTKPNYKFEWFHTEVCNIIQKFFERKLPTKKLMLFAPPQNGKSEISSRRFPAWALGRNPDLKIALTSYGASHAQAFNRDVQRIIDDDTYYRIFPETTLNESNVATDSKKGFKRTANIFEVVDKEGFLKTVGCGGSLTGTTVDLGIIDDPFKDRAEAESYTIRESRWAWYKDVFETRLHNDSLQLLLFTRWHEKDLAGKLIERDGEYSDGGEWMVITLRALKEKEKKGFNYGYIEDKRQLDEALWESKHSAAKYKKSREKSPRTFASLYQQRPAPLKGGIVDTSLFSITKENKGRIDFAINYRVKESQGYFGLIAFESRDGTTKVVTSEIINDTKKFRERLSELNEELGDLTSTCFVESNKTFDTHMPFIRSHVEIDFQYIKTPTNQIENNIRAIKPAITEGGISLFKGDWNEPFLKQCGLFPNGDDQYPSLLALAVIEGQKYHKASDRMYYEFDLNQHLNKEAVYNPNNHLHLTFDQNATPYSTLVAAQITETELTKKVRKCVLDIFEEECSSNQVRVACTNFKEKYPASQHLKGLWYYGDASMRARNTISTENGVTIVNAEFSEHYVNNAAYYERNEMGRRPQSNPIDPNKIFLSNPSLSSSTDFINWLLRGDIAGGLQLEIRIHPKCKELRKGLIHAKAKIINNSFKKIVEREIGDDGKSYELYHHTADTFRYLIVAAFYSHYRAFVDGRYNVKLPKKKEFTDKKINNVPEGKKILFQG